MRNIVINDAIDDIVVGNVAPMLRKNGIQLSANRTRSHTDNRDEDGNNNGNRVEQQEDWRQQSTPLPCYHCRCHRGRRCPTANGAACKDGYY